MLVVHCVDFQTDIDAFVHDRRYVEGGRLGRPVLFHVKPGSGCSVLVFHDDTAAHEFVADTFYTGPSAGCQLREVYFYGDHAFVSHGLLRKLVEGRAQLLRLLRFDGQPARFFRQRPVSVVRVMVELPLQPQLRSFEVVAGLWGIGFCFHAGGGLAADFHGFADAVLVVVRTHFRESVLPDDGLEVYHASLRLGGLEVVEPPFPLGRVDQGTLMRAVHFGRTHFQYALLFVRAVDVFGAHHGLPSCADTAFRDADIVISVFFEQFRAFCHRTLVHFPSLIEQCLAVCAHLMDDDGASAQLAPSDVGLPVLVPQRARVFPS